MTKRRPLLPAVAGLLLLGGLPAVSAVGQTLSEPRSLPAIGPTSPPAAATGALSLADLVRLSLERNPALAQAQLDITAAEGRAVQAGLYPNPTVVVSGEEMGSRLGPGGVITAPLVTQEIVTAGKLRLNRAVAARQLDQAGLAVQRQRYVLLTAVRQGYFEVLAARQRVEVLTELVRVATQSYQTIQGLVEVGQAAPLDALQLKIEADRLRAELGAAQREMTAAWRRLVTSLGAPELPEAPLLGTLEAPVPVYDFDRSLAFLLEAHPEAQSAQVGVERAQLALRRAQVEAVPNVTAGAGYQRHNKDREDDWTFQVSVPVPVWNRNQGNVRAAQAELGRAAREVERVQNELANRLATAFGQYAAARERAERYRTLVLPQTREAYHIVRDLFPRQFDLLRVLQAQRAVQEANLEYIRILAELWRAASEVAGLLLLEEHWPAAAPEACAPTPCK